MLPWSGKIDRAGLGRTAESSDHTGLPRRLFHVVRRCGGDVAQQQIPRAYSHGQRGPVRQVEIRGRLGGQADGRGTYDTFGATSIPGGQAGSIRGWGTRSMPAVPSGDTKNRRSSARRAEKLKGRAARGNEQVAYVRRGLKLLKSFGRGDAPPLGSPYRYAFDPLDPVAEIGPNDQALLIEFRLFYCSDGADYAAFEAPVEAPMRSESTFETTLARSGSVTGGKQGRGRKPVYDREFVRKLVFDLMEEHGEFFAGDKDWRSKADLETRGATQVSKGVSLGAVATSTIRKLIAEPLEDWRRRKVTADN